MNLSFYTEHFIYFIIGIPIALIIGAWFVFSSGLFHRVLDWVRPGSDRYIPAKIFCEDKQIRNQKLKIGRYVISDDKKRRSFYLVHSLLLSDKGKTNKFLALTERDSIPIDFHSKVSLEARGKFPTAQRVFIDTTADIRSKASREGAQNMMMMSLSIIAMCVTLAVIVLGGIVYWQSK